MRVAAASFVALIICAPPALALTATEVLMLQVNLKDHGFYQGAPTGNIGGETRDALAKFAASHNGPSDPDGAMTFMRQLSYKSSIPVSDLAIAGIVEDAIRRKTGATYVETYRLRTIESPRGTMLCGAAEIGDDIGRAFYGLVDMTTQSFILGGIDDRSSPPIVSIRCSIAFPATPPSAP